MVNDLTGKRLFFQLLHEARRISGYYWPPIARENYLSGMRKVMRDNREDFTIADNMRDYWRCQNSGAA